MKRAASCLSLLVTLLLGGGAMAQTGKDGPMAKLHQSLITLHQQHSAHVADRAGLLFSTDDPLIRLVEDYVVVDAVAAGNVEDLKADLENLGMRQAVSFGRIVSGQLPLSSIPAAASLASLRFAQSAAAMAGAGLVISQGDHAMRADLARTTFGVDGTGIKVGVLSDSFNCKGGAATDLTDGDLSPVTVLQEISNCNRGTDEGRAMLQIVHDVAPGATLSFASAFNGMASFAANIQALAAAGAKVITDDVFYFVEPFFQDGILAQAVDSVVAAGVAYFSLAGNDGRLAYDHAFAPGQFFPAGSFGSAGFLGGTAHDFNSSGTEDNFQRVTIGPHTRFPVSFQWDSPYFSAGGVGTQNDVDIYLLNAGNTTVLGAFTTNNIISGDPVEFGTIFNNGASPVDLNIMIVNRTGLNPGRIKYKVFQSPNFTIAEYATNSGTISGHQNAKGAEAVGAAWYFNTPAFGVFPPVKESYSSSGTTPILFDLAGNRLTTPDPRSDKPEIVAPDGADTAFFGGSDPDATGFPNFFGTSAAAPHAAAVAALLLQTDPSLTPAQIYAALESTAIDMGAPGFDNDSGFGLIQADAALASLLPKVSIAATDNTATEAGPTTGTFTVTRTGSTGSPLTVNYTVGGTATSGSDYVALPGSVVILTGQSSAQIVVTPIDDAASEGDETVIATLTANPAFVIGPQSSATVTIAENDAPDTIIDSGPTAASGDATNSTTAIFFFNTPAPASSTARISFNLSASVVTFECSLDNSAFSACTSPKTDTKLKPGVHNFKVQATADGVTDPTPASFDWTIDKTAPNTAITSGPPLLTNNPIATFTFTSTEVGGGFQCSLDGSPFAPCTSPFNTDPLLDGKHTFRVKAVDGAGNADKSAAKAKTWTVDTMPPVTTITKTPPSSTTSTSATFKFKSSEKSKFQCDLDHASFVYCTSAPTFPGLSLGLHHIEVRATDAAGNIDPTPAIFDWEIIP